MAYRIREFKERYEVNDKCGPWKPGQTLRVGPIDYIRAPVHGRNWTLAFREFNEICGSDAPAVYGVFCKLREIQGDNKAEFRDGVCDHRGNYMDSAQIAKVLGWPHKIVDKAMKLLSGEILGWVEEFPGVPRNSEGFPCPCVLESDQSRALDPEAETEDQSKDIPPPLGGDGCPLQSFPDILEAYPEIRDLIVQAHPRAKLPDLDSKAELKDRKALADLVRLDGHTQVEVVKVTKWVLTEEVPSASGFCWRDQFQSFGGLRTKKPGETMTKFAKMCEAHDRAISRSAHRNGGGRLDLGAPTPEDIARNEDVYASIQRQSDEYLEKINEQLKAKQEAAQ